MAPAASKQRGAYWNSGDDVTLHNGFDRRRFSPNLRTKSELEPIRLKYFQRIPYRNFRTNFLKKAAQWQMDQEARGNNNPDGELLSMFLQQCSYSL